VDSNTDFRWFRVCDQADIADPGSRAFVLHATQGDISGFVVRQRDHFYAFVNRCSHTGVELNWGSGVGERFFDLAGQFIQCSMHGALFRLSDGMCVQGPCRGQALQRLNTRIEPHGLYVG